MVEMSILWKTKCANVHTVFLSSGWGGAYIEIAQLQKRNKTGPKIKNLKTICIFNFNTHAELYV